MTLNDEYEQLSLENTQLFPDAERLHHAFRGKIDGAGLGSIVDAAARMVPLQHKRTKAIRQMCRPDELPESMLRQAVGDFTSAEVSLAALATVVDRAVTQALGGRAHVSGVWHTETVGLVISRMAELWLNYLESARHEDASWVARMSDAYNCLITELAEGRRLPPDM